MNLFKPMFFLIIMTVVSLHSKPAVAYQLTEAAVEEPKFIKYVDESGNKSLQVAVVRYQLRMGGDQSVDLIGAVHIGDRQYYHDLNALFKTYDAVLFEAVMPEGQVIPAGGFKSKGTLSNIQSGLGNLLGLTFQMEEVDYTPKHFVHADFTPEEFKQSMDAKGESVFSMVFNLWRAGVSEQLTGQASSSDFDMMMALLSADRENAFKTILAKEFANAEGSMKILEGSEGSTIVAERNKKALKVLKQEMKSQQKSFAIFYGAAHLPDFHERLMREFDMVPVSTRWIDAWKLK